LARQLAADNVGAAAGPASGGSSISIIFTWPFPSQSLGLGRTGKIRPLTPRLSAAIPIAAEIQLRPSLPLVPAAPSLPDN